MNDRLTGWLTLSANAAVLVGIVLIVVELDQNRDSIRAQTRNEISTTISEYLALIASDAELSSIRRRADAGEELTSDEAYRYELLTISLLRYWENTHYQYRQGLYDEVEFERHAVAIASYVKYSRRFQEVWCRIRPAYSPEFAAHIDAARDEKC